MILQSGCQSTACKSNSVLWICSRSRLVYWSCRSAAHTVWKQNDSPLCRYVTSAGLSSSVDGRAHVWHINPNARKRRCFFCNCGEKNAKIYLKKQHYEHFSTSHSSKYSSALLLHLKTYQKHNLRKSQSLVSIILIANTNSSVSSCAACCSACWSHGCVAEQVGGLQRAASVLS